MFRKLKEFFSAPTFINDEDKTRRARLLHVILLAQAVILILILATTLLSSITTGISNINTLGIVFGSLVVNVVFRFLMQRGWVDSAVIGLLLAYIAALTAGVASGGTINSLTVIFYPVAIVIATLLISRRAGFIFFIATSLVIGGLMWAELNGRLPVANPSISITSVVTVVTGLGLTLILLNLATQGTDEALKKALDKEQEVRELAASLEKRVAERTKALTASAEVSRRISTILDPNHLVHEVVEQIKSTFNYYHAHIYLKNETTDELIMAGGTGEVGKTLLARGHKIPKGKGLVGRAAETNQLILVSDTTAEPNWLPNELLPETKSEIAVPISLGSDVLGVLDVQQNNINGLTQEDAELLQAISYQVAVALRNAQTYSYTQQIAERESLINEISRKIQNTATIEQALQVTVRELGTALSAKDSRVVLSLPENQ
ncbi:MAG: GAF domain-containing protein [Anaerolineales bacterium]|nr:GAF domain-containing protein [Anaerolineales bacterium]